MSTPHDSPEHGPRGKGNYYFCIKTDLSEESGEIYAWAERVRVDPSGSLILLNHEGHINLAFAPRSWRGIYAASVLDGHAVAVEIWPGEVIR